MTTEQRTIAGVSKSMSYAYNLDGSMKSLTYPSNRAVNYTYNSAARLASVMDANGTPYASSLTHWPTGAQYQWHLPNIYFRTDLNKRLQVSRLYSDNGVTAGYFMDKTYNYGALNNGNVTSIVNNKDTSRSETFTYDALNRITAGWTTANTGAYSWGENYDIDAWGNLEMSPMAGKAQGGNFQCSGDGQNRATCLGYDAAGNVTANGSATYTYDPENRISSTAGMTYTYDADGNRVEKSSGITGTLYWYGAPGIIAESDLTGALKSEYVFFNGKRVARIDLPGNSVHYYLSDHLNSTSMVVSAAGTVEEESDYSPFGTEYVVTGGGANHYKFTGKERDSESGLDYFGARYYSNGLGRFITPDWAAKATAVPYADFADPQSLNLYTYVRNIPTTRLDFDGHVGGDDRNLLQQWGDVIEVKASVGLSVGGSVQAGVEEHSWKATLVEVEGKTGLGGGNADVKIQSGIKGKAKVGSAAAQIKAGGELSLKDGANVKTSAEATLGSAKVQVSVDKNGVHETAGLGTDANKDTKLGASFKLGIGVGVSLNLSQAQRALINTGNAVQDATRNALDRVLPGWESKFEQDGQQH